MKITDLITAATSCAGLASASVGRTGSVKGRKSHAEANPELVVLVRQLGRRRPKSGQRSLREILAQLAARGFMNERGNAFSAASINSMLRAR